MTDQPAKPSPDTLEGQKEEVKQTSEGYAKALSGGTEAGLRAWAEDMMRRMRNFGKPQQPPTEGGPEGGSRG